MIKKVFADDINSIFGKISPPITNMPSGSDPQTSLIQILNVLLNLVFVVAGLFTLWNLILAGYKYINAGGDAKKISEANTRITFTVLGLLIIVIAPLIAALFGIIVFGRWDAILNPDIKRFNPAP